MQAMTSAGLHLLDGFPAGGAYMRVEALGANAAWLYASSFTTVCWTENCHTNMVMSSVNCGLVFTLVGKRCARDAVEVVECGNELVEEALELPPACLSASQEAAQ
ncbi:hypothetical protein HK404_05170 [Myxococcus xanthus]|nr:hypothetical protein [Myxococcus xanthus]